MDMEIEQQESKGFIFSSPQAKSTSVASQVPTTVADDLQWINHISECPTYYPTKEEFEDPLEYLQKIAPNASKHGIVKIKSPLTASVPAPAVLAKEYPGFNFRANKQPLRLATQWGKNDQVPFFKPTSKLYTLPEYEAMANKAFARRYSIAATLSAPYLEKEFWREMTSASGSCNPNPMVEYASDIDGSVFSSSPNDELAKSKWNLKTFARLPQSVLRHLRNEIAGVTYPMLYFGMLFSMFSWHVEDQNLYSINYHHCGEAKIWYGVPGNAALQFEKVAQEQVYSRDILLGEREEEVFDVLSRKTTMFPPSLLLQHHVPVYRAVQRPGEFVITFPRSYHAGFSQGFNCGEAVNFAIGDWFPIGDIASLRYSLLNRLTLLSHEELLCKEARRLCEQGPHSEVSRHCIKVSFVNLMRFQQRARWSLTQSKGCRSIPIKSRRSLNCSLCNRSCYVAYWKCKCHKHPICLHHEKELQECPCGSNGEIYTRDGLCEMENVSQKFEEEDGIIQKAKQLSAECGNDLYMQAELCTYSKDDHEVYTPDDQEVHCSKYEDLSVNMCSESLQNMFNHLDWSFSKVKRRSPMTRKKHIFSEKMDSCLLEEHQGLKRLKKLHSEERHPQYTGGNPVR